MKTKLTLLLLCLPLLSLAAERTVTLAWDYPTNLLSANLVFRLRHTTDAAQPKDNWTIMTNVVGTQTSVAVRVVPGEHFFVLTAVATNNFWLESDFSNVAQTPAPPLSGVLRIRLGTEGQGLTFFDSVEALSVRTPPEMILR